MARHDGDPVRFKVGSSELTKLGTKRFDFGDPYHIALTMRWPGFFGACLAIYLALNLAFAVLYDLVPHCIADVPPGSLANAFFFSIETLATVGYGVMAPQSMYGHIVASVELTTGLVFTALFTGLIFVRFSRIKAKIIFAKTVVVARHEGVPTLMIRLGYDRAGFLGDAEARVTFMRLLQTAEGNVFRQSDELKLVRSRLALMVLTWTLMHEIDETSPFWGFTPESLITADARLIVTIRARNHAAGAEVFDMFLYNPKDVAFGMIYQDVVNADATGKIQADLRKLDLVEPEARVPS